MNISRIGSPHRSTCLKLPAEARSVASARRVVSGVCDEVGLPREFCETTALLISEAVTNAVVHGRSEVRLAIDAGPGGMRVEVGDDNSRLPTRRLQDVNALDGRGMALLDALASDWGTQPQPPGKIVWFELRV
jgi:anti-sigma regulatory factor (Ser/Thr protein kinase)